MSRQAVVSAPRPREHGTRAKYVAERCRCAECRAANTTEQRRRERRKLYARWNGGAVEDLVDAEPARRHVKALMAAGIGRRRIAEVSGVSGGSLTKLLYGGPAGRPPARRIRPATARKLLAVRANPADGARVDATGTRRRLQALVACGWTKTHLAAELGQTPSNFNVTLHAHQVYASTMRAVRALYDRLWDQPPPETTRWERQAASRARNYARTRGWPRPMAWDDELIDDPQHQPHCGIERRRRTRAATPRHTGGEAA